MHPFILECGKYNVQKHTLCLGSVKTKHNWKNDTRIELQLKLHCFFFTLKGKGQI